MAAAVLVPILNKGASDVDLPVPVAPTREQGRAFSMIKFFNMAVNSGLLHRVFHSQCGAISCPPHRAGKSITLNAPVQVC